MAERLNGFDRGADDWGELDGRADWDTVDSEEQDILVEGENSPEYKRKLEKGIKVVIGGPPQSGKSNLVHALEYLLGDDCYLLSAAPDGEGKWYHENYDDPTIRALRQKGEFTEEFTARKAKQVEDWADTPITLIDIGGKIDDKNARIIQGATHAIALAGSGKQGDLHAIEELETWADFFTENNLKVIGKIHSEFDPEATDLQVAGANDGHVTGRTHHLVRGENIRERETVQELAELIYQMADANVFYQRAHEEGKFSSVVRVDKLLEDLPGKTEEIRLHSGRVTGSAKWLAPEAVPGIYHKVATQYAGLKHPLLNGKTANWGVVAIAMAFYEQGAESVGLNSPDGMTLAEPLTQTEDYDEQWWAEPQEIGEIDGRPVVEVYSKVSYSKNPLDPRQLPNLQIPEVPEGSMVVLSGAMPQWLAASATLGYSQTAAAVAVRALGQGDIVAWAQDEDYLGWNVRI